MQAGSASKIYDTADQSAPSLVKSFSVEGNLLSSRKNGDILYLITQKYPYFIQDMKEADILPAVKDDKAPKDAPMATTIALPNEDFTSTVTVSALDIASDLQGKTMNFLGNGSAVYMNEDHLFIAGYSYNAATKKQETSITKLSVVGQETFVTAHANVEGLLLNQFSWMNTKRIFAWSQPTKNGQFPLYPGRKLKFCK
jgi:uncharacterized secreted protein with C-terminal beta-propeller domain